MLKIKKYSNLSSAKHLKRNSVYNYYNLIQRRCKMGKILVKNVVDRKPGHLYYVDGKGNVCEAKMARGGRKKKKAAKKTTKKKR